MGRMTHIGGHRKQPNNDGPGLDVFRDGDRIIKSAHTQADKDGIHNEARMLKKLSESGFTPELLEEHDDYIVEENIGVSQPVDDGERFRRECAALLWTLRAHRIRHGDLTGANIIIRDDRPYLIDFQQSNIIGESAPQKRPLSDSYFLWRYAANVPARQHPTPDSPRVIRRWLAVLGALKGFQINLPLNGQSMMDLGCFLGDFCAMAADEGMETIGIDTGGFNTDYNSIEEGRRLWNWYGIGVNLFERNIMECTSFESDIVLLFSTWPYIVQNFGRFAAEDLIGKIMKQTGSLFFETQLAGDGPGPDFLVTDDDVANMLGQFGNPQPLVTIPVTGRQASRTVWHVTP